MQIKVLRKGVAMLKEYLWKWFLGLLLGNFSTNEIKHIEKAFVFSRRAHQGVLRRDGTPYFNHVVRAAIIPFILGIFNTELTVVILLHDVLEENRKVTFYQLEKLFGITTANRIQMLTKLKNRTSQFYFDSLLACDDWIVLFAKLCDRLDNQRTLEVGDPEWQAKKNIETVTYFPRILTRCEKQILLAIQKKRLPRKNYGVVCMSIKKLYYETMHVRYKKYFA